MGLHLFEQGLLLLLADEVVQDGKIMDEFVPPRVLKAGIKVKVAEGAGGGVAKGADQSKGGA